MLMFVGLEVSEQWWEMLPYLMLSRTHCWLKQIHVVTIVPTRNNYRSVRIRINAKARRLLRLQALRVSVFSSQEVLPDSTRA